MTRTQNPLSVEYSLLGFLFQAPAHGYDLFKKMSVLDGIGLIWRVKQSHLYALLDKLEKEGLLAAKMVPGDTYPARKEFYLTDAGKEEFESWLTSPVRHGRDMRQEFLAKLYFAQKAKGATSRKLIEKQMQECEGWLATLQIELQEVSSQNTYQKVILQYRQSQTKAMTEWLQELLKEETFNS
jgi:PadR family transcriptional regulator, regulatory protein AphA